MKKKQKTPFLILFLINESLIKKIFFQETQEPISFFKNKITPKFKIQKLFFFNFFSSRLKN